MLNFYEQDIGETCPYISTLKEHEKDFTELKYCKEQIVNVFHVEKRCDISIDTDAFLDLLTPPALFE